MEQSKRFLWEYYFLNVKVVKEAQFQIHENLNNENKENAQHEKVSTGETCAGFGS